MEMNEVLEKKVKELEEMSVKDDGFKDAVNGVCNLMETTNKIESQEKERSDKKRDNFWSKVLLVATSIAVPIGLSVITMTKGWHRYSNMRRPDAL